MPTVFRFGAMRVVIYPNDHRPPHVHVIGQGHEAVFATNGTRGIVTLRENYGFSRRDLVGIQNSLLQNLSELLQAWKEIHGT